jgi:hypothetical protein
MVNLLGIIDKGVKKSYANGGGISNSWMGS